MKKFLSLVVALVMVIALAIVPVYASGPSTMNLGAGNMNIEENLPSITLGVDVTSTINYDDTYSIVVNFTKTRGAVTRTSYYSWNAQTLSWDLQTTTATTDTAASLVLTVTNRSSLPIDVNLVADYLRQTVPAPTTLTQSSDGATATNYTFGTDVRVNSVSAHVESEVHSPDDLHYVTFNVVYSDVTVRLTTGNVCEFLIYISSVNTSNT